MYGRIVAVLAKGSDHPASWYWPAFSGGHPGVFSVRGMATWASPVYHDGDAPLLTHNSEGRFILSETESGGTRVELTWQMSVETGRNSGLGNPHGPSQFSESVAPTTIQEYLVLRQCATALGVTDWPQARVPDGALDALRVVAGHGSSKRYAAQEWDAIYTLAALGDRSVLDLLAVPEPELRHVFAVAMIPGPESTRLPSRWIDTGNVYVIAELSRRRAAASLVVPGAERWLRGEPEEYAETAVRDIVRLAPGDRAIVLLRSALRARRPGTRLSAAAGLVALGVHDDLTLGVLATEWRAVRERGVVNALLILGEGGATSEPAVPFLEARAAEGPSGLYRTHLVSAIARIRAEDARARKSGVDQSEAPEPETNRAQGGQPATSRLERHSRGCEGPCRLPSFGPRLLRDRALVVPAGRSGGRG